MSVLIKDMGKPKSCYAVIDGEYEYCPFVNTDDDCVLLLKKGTCEETWEDQYSKCPLIEAPELCEDAVSRQAAIDALMVRDKELRNINWYDKPYAEGECRGIDEALTIVSNLPSVQPDFDITVKIDKAYDDGYKAGYLQGRHDWGDLDE